MDEYQQLFILNEDAQQHEIGGSTPAEQLCSFAKEALGIYFDTIQLEAGKEGGCDSAVMVE